MIHQQSLCYVSGHSYIHVFSIILHFFYGDVNLQIVHMCVCRHSSVYYNAKARRSPLCAGTKNKESSLLLFFRFVLLFTMPICGIVSNREKNTTSGNWMCVYLCASVPSYNTWKTIPTEINLMNEHWTYFFLELEINNLWLFVCK